MIEQITFLSFLWHHFPIMIRKWQIILNLIKLKIVTDHVIDLFISNHFFNNSRTYSGFKFLIKA